MLSVCSPIPAGVLTPSFILGAVLGRLYGYILKAIGTSLGITLIRCTYNVIKPTYRRRPLCDRWSSILGRRSDEDSVHRHDRLRNHRPDQPHDPTPRGHSHCLRYQQFIGVISV